jgi:hypothetical protein
MLFKQFYIFHDLIFENICTCNKNIGIRDKRPFINKILLFKVLKLYIELRFDLQN